MRSLPTAEQVWECLDSGATIAQAERVTGWPAHTIRNLVNRRRGWLVDEHGRAVEAARLGPRAGGPPRKQASQPELMAARRLHAALAARKEELGLTWAEVATRLGTTTRTLACLPYDCATGTLRTRARRWLADTAHEPHHLHAELVERRTQLGLSWSKALDQAGVSYSSVRVLSRGRLPHAATCERLRAWLDRTAPTSSAVDLWKPAALYAALAERKDLLRLTWWQVAVQVGSCHKTLNALRFGTQPRRATRDRIRRWLDRTAPAEQDRTAESHEQAS